MKTRLFYPAPMPDYGPGPAYSIAFTDILRMQNDNISVDTQRHTLLSILTDTTRVTNDNNIK